MGRWEDWARSVHRAMHPQPRHVHHLAHHQHPPHRRRLHGQLQLHLPHPRLDPRPLHHQDRQPRNLRPPRLQRRRLNDSHRRLCSTPHRQPLLALCPLLLAAGDCEYFFIKR